MRLEELYQIKNLKFNSSIDIVDYLYNKKIIKSDGPEALKKINSALINLKNNQTVYINKIPIKRTNK